MTTSSELSGKVAVITGGSRGIGKAVAAALVARGVRVVIGDVLDEEGEAAVEELNKQRFALCNNGAGHVCLLLVVSVQWCQGSCLFAHRCHDL